MCEYGNIFSLYVGELLTFGEKKYRLISYTQTSSNMPGSTTTVLYPKEAKFNMVRASVLTISNTD